MFDKNAKQKKHRLAGSVVRFLYIRALGSSNVIISTTGHFRHSLHALITWFTIKLAGYVRGWKLESV